MERKRSEMKRKRVLILLFVVSIVIGVIFVCIRQKNIVVDTNKNVDTNINKIIDKVSKLYKGADEKKIREILGTPDEVINLEHHSSGSIRYEFFCFSDGQIIISLLNNKLQSAMWTSKGKNKNDYGHLLPIELK